MADAKITVDVKTNLPEVKSLAKQTAGEVETLKTLLDELQKVISKGFSKDNILSFGKSSILAAKEAGASTVGVDALMNSIQELKIAVGNVLIPALDTVAPMVDTAVQALAGLAGALGQVTSWLAENQGVVEGAAVAAAAFFAAWEAASLAEFIINAGGVSGALGQMAAGLKAVTLEKLKDKAETLQLAALYVKDWAVAMAANVVGIGQDIAAWVALRAEWVIGKAQLIAATVAETAHTVAAQAATLATTAFGAAVAFLTSPIGLVVAAIAALIAIVVLMVTHWDEIKAAAAACWDAIVSAWEQAGQWFHDTIVAPIKGFFAELWDSIKLAASNAWEGICGVWTAVSTWFGTNITGPVGEAFSGLWTNISTWASGAWAGIQETFAKVAKWFDEHLIQPVRNGFKGFVNGLIGYVESFVNFFIRGINKIISGFNSLSIRIPDNPITGAVTLGFNIPKIQELKLPRLATGAVIPPNRAFMAVLGDQRRGTNIETPEGLLRQIFREESGSAGVVAELREILAAVREGQILMVDKRVLGRTVQASLADSARAGGAAPMPVR